MMGPGTGQGGMEDWIGIGAKELSSGPRLMINVNFILTDYTVLPSEL